MDLNKIQEEIFSLIPEALAEIPENFNFTENLAIEIKIGENIKDKSYCNDIDLEVQITGLLNKKKLIQEKAFNLHKALNKYIFKNYKAVIQKEDVWNSSFKDKEKFTSVLMYRIRNFIY